MQNLFRNVALSAVALATVAVAANADTLVLANQTAGYTLTRWGTGTGANPLVTFTFAKFDTMGGTRVLNSVVFNLTGNVSTTFTGQDRSGTANSVDLTSAGTVATGRIGTVFTNVGFPPASSTLVAVTPTNTTTLAVAANATFGPRVVNSTSSANATYTSSDADFANYIGSGNFVIPVAAIGSSSVSDINGNVTSTVVTTAQAIAGVTYNYTVRQVGGVPEPSAVAFAAIAGVSMVGMMVRARRRG